MRTNLHKIDRATRLVLGVLAIDMPVGGVVSGINAVLCLILAAYLLITAFVGRSPVYYFFGISTTKEKKSMNKMISYEKEDLEK